MISSQDPDHQWMSRCFVLARRGIGLVSPNPPVGAILVFNGKVLGEGFHSYFGGPHAEVEAFKNVKVSDRHLIPKSTLYVSLEPCCTTGKTPACTDLILREGVKDVRVATQDPNPDIAGRGIEILRSHGVEIKCGILESEAIDLIRPFTINILQKRPYVILKWAQSKYGYIGKPNERIWLSHPYTNVWSHKKRSMVDAIMAGARTVILDDPRLTTREYPGRSPHRVIYDPNGQLNRNYKVFNADGNKVYYFSRVENTQLNEGHIIKQILSDQEPEIDQIFSSLYAKQIGILLVEGGAYVHDFFIRQNAWDEAWVIRTSHILNEGIEAPNLRGKLIEEVELETDRIIGIRNEQKY